MRISRRVVNEGPADRITGLKPETSAPTVRNFRSSMFGMLHKENGRCKKGGEKSSSLCWSVSDGWDGWDRWDQWDRYDQWDR
jgi:hypothetical protein